MLVIQEEPVWPLNTGIELPQKAVSQLNCHVQLMGHQHRQARICSEEKRVLIYKYKKCSIYTVGQSNGTDIRWRSRTSLAKSLYPPTNLRSLPEQPSYMNGEVEWFPDFSS